MERHVAAPKCHRNLADARDGTSTQGTMRVVFFFLEQPDTKRSDETIRHGSAESLFCIFAFALEPSGARPCRHGRVRALPNGPAAGSDVFHAQGLHTPFFLEFRA